MSSPSITLTSEVDDGRLGAPGSKIRKKSHDSLKAHPLLGDEEASTPASRPALGPTNESSNGQSVKPQAAAPYSLNYKPRQRPPSTSGLTAFSQPTQVNAATTTTSVSIPPSPGSPSSSSGATTKLQLQSLSATLQTAGLSQESLGWLLAHKLASDLDKDAEWQVLAAALRTGKACLLLPRAEASSTIITPRVMRNYLCLKDGRGMMTLSGLRGVKYDDVLTLSSQVPYAESETKITRFQQMAPPVLEASFPSIDLSQPLELHLPRLPTSTKPAKAAPKRSLASLFGGQRPTAPAHSPRSSSDGLGLAPEPADQAIPSITVSAYTVETTIDLKKTGKAIQQAMEQHVRSTLAKEDSRVVDMTLHFLNRFSVRSKSSPSLQSTFDETKKSLVDASVDEMTAAAQEFFYDVHNRVEEAQQERAALAEALEEDGVDEKSELRQEEGNDQVLERIEKLVCELLYDRLFSPPISPDRQDDESLATRIAGLHMLDLTLDHLGLDVEGAARTGDEEDEHTRQIIREGLAQIISKCGTVLSRLQDTDCRSPRDKLQVLIEVHKIIADSLQQLPPIPMKTESPSGNGAAGSKSATQVFELSDDAKSLGVKSSRRSRREESISPAAEDMTPRMPASRPVSVLSDPVPAIKLPETAISETYGLSTKSSFVEEPADLTSTSYFETRSPRQSTDETAQPKAARSTAASADAILPILIYTVVQANPSRLVSHVLYVQRFRADSLMRGEGEYCLYNMEAVRQFLMSCDVGTLGLGSDKIMTTADASPAPLRMRDRAGQQLDVVVGSAGKVLGTAADIGLGGYRILGGLLARSASASEASNQPKTIEDVQNVLSGSSSSPSRTASLRNSILRRGTISSVVPSLRSADTDNKKEQEMTDVSSDNSVKAPTIASQPMHSAASISSRLAALPGLSRFGASTSSERSTVEVPPLSPTLTSEHLSQSPLLGPFSLPQRQGASSVLSAEPSESGALASPPATPGLRDRAVSFMSHSQHHSLLRVRERSGSNSSHSSLRHSATSTPGSQHGSTNGPIKRFLHCEAEDLKLSEVSLLLADYKRLAAILQASGQAPGLTQ